MQVAWQWSTAGGAVSMTPHGEWLAGKLPRRVWPAPGVRQGWDTTWGDRKTALAFIFQAPTQRAAGGELAACFVLVYAV
jgi:hypothetical protein